MALSLRPTTSATRPPMPASTSSNTSVLPGVVQAGHGVQGQQDARQLAAGGDPRQRPQLLAGVGREQRTPPLSMPALGPAGRVVGVAGRHIGLEADLEAGLLHRQLAKRRASPSFPGRVAAARRLRRELTRRGEVLARARRACRFQPRAPARSAGEDPGPAAPRGSAAPNARTSSTVAPYFRLSRSIRARRVSISSSRPGDDAGCAPGSRAAKSARSSTCAMHGAARPRDRPANRGSIAASSSTFR